MEIKVNLMYFITITQYVLFIFITLVLYMVEKQ